MAEIALTTSVESFTSDYVYRIRSFLKNSQACICVIDNDNFKWIPVDTSDSLKKVIFGEQLSLVDDSDILHMHRRKRLLVLGQFDDQKPVVIDNEFSISFIKREINNRQFAIRSFSLADCLCTSNKYKKHSFYRKSITKRFDTKDKRNRLNNSLLPIENRSLSPRAEHSTKVGQTSHETPYVIHAYPCYNNVSNIGLTRRSEDIGNGLQGHDKLSIPVTDCSGPASYEVVTNGPARYKSIINRQTVEADGGACRGSTTYGSYTPNTNSHINSHTPVSRQQDFAPSTGNYRTNTPPRHPDYANFNHRLQSFGSWPLSGKPDKTSLARWGFFATGAQDLVRCYHCGIGLKDWISDDDVMTQHIKHSCDCPFLLNDLGHERLQRLKIAILYPDTINQDSTLSSAPQVTLPYKIRHPRYQTMEARMASYEKFPSHILQTPQQCSVAGFFFTGEKDICRCFTCDGGLQRWDPEDDPIIEHAKYFPTCDYLKQLKGENYIQQMQMTFKASQQQGAAGGPSDQMNGMKSTTTDNLNHTMNEMTFQATFTNDTSRQKDNSELLRTDVAKPALDMGYSKKDVSKAIEKMRNKGLVSFTADELVNCLLDNMDTVHSSDNQFEINRDANKSNTDTAYLAAENERLKSLTTCMLCLTGETNILCLPCTHHKTCHECSKTLSHCPVCGRYIQEKIRTYMA